MFSSYLDFEITIAPFDESSYVLAVHGPGGDARRNLVLPSRDPRYQALFTRLQHLDTDEHTIQELGQILFQTIFQGPVHEVYTRSQGILQAGQGLRLILNLASATAELAALPWEYISDPDQGPLALLDVSVVRYLAQQQVIPQLEAALPLKVLLTGAETPPTPGIERELQTIQDALAGLGTFVHVTLEPHLTVEKLQHLLRGETYHVWHFIGHSGFDEAGTTGLLAFEDATRDHEWVTAPQLGILLNRTGIRLVVLSACQGARLAFDPYRSLAPALVRAHVPAVVAMQFSIPQEATRAFAGEFYQALAEGFPIDACVTEGRKAIMNATGLRRPDWGIPVVYTRAPDGMLFNLPALPKPPCPYPGMVPFRAEDARFFYGREAEIEQMLQHLRYERLLFVIGPSGSGKSSLVRAGLLPRLPSSSLFQPEFWLVRELRPGSNPITALNQIIVGDLAQASLSVKKLLEANSPAQRLLLVVDQFEEVFVQADSDERQRFIITLQELRRSEDCVLLIAMRADFFPDLMTSDLWPINANQRLEISPLRGLALRQAIDQPASDVGVRLEPGFVERLMADAANEPGVLPLLQETMVLLWDKMVHRLMPIHAYEQLGQDGRSGLAVALARKADATVTAFSSTQQMIARRIFLRLIQFGEGRADTRRQQSLAALRGVSNDQILFDQIIRTLASARLLTLSGAEDGGDPRVDIAHEALITSWPTLQQWLTERRAAEQIRRRLEAKAQEWVRLGRSHNALLDEVELLEVQRWLDSDDSAELGYDEQLGALASTSRASLEAEAAAKDASNRRERELERRAYRRLLSVVVVLGTLVLLFCGWFAVREYQRQRARAEGVVHTIGSLAVAFERAEATNGRFARCVAAGPCLVPPRELSTYYRSDAENFPVTGVDAYQAAAFCQWIGRRLPTRAEWHAAATQEGHVLWPWGNAQLSSTLANLEPQNPDQTPGPAQVGSYPQGQTPEELYDLVGNVAEWTATAWHENEPDGVPWDGRPESAYVELAVMGGNFNATISGYTEAVPAQTYARLPDTGFRCVEGGDAH